ncbi:MAG: hypothetical protein GWP21_07430 [Euryarchaeota archaeon]|nr:hypothetical protein [Euryarchaeota archaeon]
MNKSKIFKVLLLAATLLLAGCTGDAEEEEELAPSDDGGELSTYSFEGSDSAQDNSVNGGDELLLVVLDYGDAISWASVEVTISVNDEAPMICEPNDSSASCTYDHDADQEWNVGDEIMISEGQNDLCSEECDIAVTIKNKQESKILDSFEVLAS